MNDLPVELYFEEIGRGKPIIFLHGYPLDHTIWLPVAQLLQDKARCILPDLHGMGKSPVVGTEATILQMATDVIHLMDRLTLDQAIIVGHSMGGYIAMSLAHNFPERVCGLGLVTTRAEPDLPAKVLERLASREEVLKNGSSRLIDEMAGRLTDKPAIRQQILPIMQKTSPQGIAAALFAMAHREDAAPWLKSIDFPVFTAAGGMDILSPEQGLKEMSLLLKHGKFYTSPTATHMLPMEEPGLITRALQETYLL